MSMMCAVISDPFWAGLLKQITAHTPASAFQNNNLHNPRENHEVSLEFKL